MTTTHNLHRALSQLFEREILTSNRLYASKIDHLACTKLDHLLSSFGLVLLFFVSPRFVRGTCLFFSNPTAKKQREVHNSDIYSCTESALFSIYLAFLVLVVLCH